jgi:hypothetical protein
MRLSTSCVLSLSGFADLFFISEMVLSTVLFMISLGLFGMKFVVLDGDADEAFSRGIHTLCPISMNLLDGLRVVLMGRVVVVVLTWCSTSCRSCTALGRDRALPENSDRTDI